MIRFIAIFFQLSCKVTKISIFEVNNGKILRDFSSYTIGVVCECHTRGIVGVRKAPYLCIVKQLIM